MQLTDRLPFAVAPTAWRYAGVPFVLAIPLVVITPPVGGLLVLAGLAVLWFHRDPDRVAPPAGIVSPADGRVSVLRETDEGVRIGVFLNVTDVHVTRAPAPGTVTSLTHSPGRHLPAFTKESERNEQVRIDCEEYAVVLIAGAVARRIHPYVTDGDALERGERIGHISFGSRADVILPESFDLENVEVEVGQRVRAGETVVAARRVERTT